MGAVRDFLACFRMGLPLPVCLEGARGRCLVHVSDTPSAFYGDLNKLLGYLEPLCLVHTGDLVDEVKLGLRPGDDDLFRRKLKSLVKAMGKVPGERVTIVAGNHDLAGEIHPAFPRAKVFERGVRLSLCGLDVALAHSREELPQPPAAFNLFGHNADVMPDREGVRYLNGVLGINVILVESGEVAVLPYPLYVDDARSCKRKRGL
ncbi:MAG: metallophosphoesterase [Thermovirgaceae bacterium]|nr:metallophosphoesterase [Synergistales bacterium]HPC76495.1 metallophosphoesterase [Synergistales bacterium]HRU91287.1 metallophosphoesterase [Thermovirgaceae bacterium]